MITRSLLLRSLPLLGLLLLTGCMSMPSRHDDAAWAPTPPPPPPAAPPSDGAIYQAGQNMELFTDPRAHRVGDILTIALVENMQASKKATTDTSKKDVANLGAPTLLGHALTFGGSPASIGTSGDRTFSGSGDSSQSNQLTGEITVTVAQRLSNGNMVVRGEKWVTINQGRELIRVSGIVRPQDILPDNSVPSTRVADARITYNGRGALAEANSQGWLSRFFSSKWMPF